MSDVLDRTYAHLDTLRGRLRDLLEPEALMLGTPQRWSQRDMTPEQLAHKAAADREDRVAKVISLATGQPIIGHSPAPIRIAVLDARTEVETTLAAVEATVCEWFGLTPLERPGPNARITRLIGLLDRIGAHDELAVYVEGEARRLDRLTARALGDAEPIHRFDARCPHCFAKSLRAFPERETVACINPGCRCGDETCVCAGDRPRRHTWPYEQWQNLAEILGAAA